jgi:bacteriocin resistance YdeI/OmpD-like protein
VSETVKGKVISGGVVHDLPEDLKKALTANAKALATWEDITPLARNEWICWIESAKKSRNKNSPDRMGLFQPQRRKAETLLLAVRIVEIIAIQSTPRKTSSASLPKPDCGMRSGESR